MRLHDDWISRGWIKQEDYQHMYKRSIEDPENFWGDQAKRLLWKKPWKRVNSSSFLNEVQVRWFEGGQLNVSENCIDRHLNTKSQQTALIWERDDSSLPAVRISYLELHRHVCRFANVLRRRGVSKGDRVTIYLPMIPEAVYAMLACARIGAIHSVVFGGFSPESLMGRIQDCQSRFVITADEGRRGGKLVPLKINVDQALKNLGEDLPTLVIQNTKARIDWNSKKDFWYHEEVAFVEDTCEPEVMNAEDPLFILYTSGSTNKPKGVLHATGGYLLHAAFSHEVVFDYHPNDIYWCTADIGWVTGHSYLVYGPLANGATTLLFEGIPTYPNAARLWQIIDRHQVNIFYTAPTAIRALMREGDDWLTKSSRKSLRLLGSVGEPINPEAWKWYFEKVGEGRCPIVDTWWQTETGGIMISPLPGAIPPKPGSATLPFFGVDPLLVNDDGLEIQGAGEGNLCIRSSWPGQMTTVYRDHERFKTTYFSQFPGKYFTGDGCRRDEDGYYWITGRVDDVINVAGHRLGTAEIESALVAHPDVAEAAVVGVPHDLKGQGIYAFVSLKAEVTPSSTLKVALVAWVRKEISPIATPDWIQFAEKLPKTRSGKIMRRILRKIAEGKPNELGDISSLAEPSVVEDLLAHRAIFVSV